MFCRSAVAVKVLMLGCLVPGANGAELLYTTDFETHPGSTWTFPAGAGWSQEAAFSGSSSAKSTVSSWVLGPWVPTVSGQYYHFTARARADGPHAQYVGMVIPGDSQWHFVDWISKANRPFFSSPSGANAYVDDITMSRITHAEARALADEHWTRVHGGGSFQFADTNRHDNLPATMSKLRTGERLNVLLLGDSIMGDISGGTLEPLIARHYPDANIAVDATIRGSTGAWYYKDHMSESVFDKNPDLVIIGGISHRDDLDSLASVIDQIQQNENAIEILLLSEIAGSLDPAAPSVRAPLDPTGEQWRSKLYRLAAEKDVGFADISEHWTTFVHDSGKGKPYYMRDAIHNNGYGVELAGRIVGDFFTPVPEPHSIGLLGLAAILGRRRRSKS